GERPVGHALAVREAPPPVPVGRLCDAVEVLVELPRESRLADAGDAGHGDEVHLAALGAFVEEILGPPQVAVATDERRLEPGRLELAPRTGDDPERAPEGDRLVLALERVLARGLVDDRLLGCPSCRVPHEHGAGLGGRLDTRRRVYEIARHHPLAFGTD